MVLAFRRRLRYYRLVHTESLQGRGTRVLLFLSGLEGAGQGMMNQPPTPTPAALPIHHTAG